MKMIPTFLAMVLVAAMVPLTASATGEGAGGSGESSGLETGGGTLSVVESTAPAVTPPEYPDLGGAGTSGGTMISAWDEIRGTIEAVDTARRRITIRDDQGNLASYDLSAGAQVKVAGRDSSLTALSHGDSVIVKVTDQEPTHAREIRVDTAQQ